MTNDNDQAFHEIVSAQQEIDRLRAALMEWENREGSCCPEGVPFEKVIEKLRAELEAAKRDNAQLAAALIVARKIAAWTPRPPNAITYERGVEIVNMVQDDLCPALDKTPTALRELLLPIQADAEAIANLSCTTCLSFEAQSFKATEIAQQILTRLRELFQ